MHNITLIPGDGIGPEITEAAKVAIEATGVNISWEVVKAGADVVDQEGTPLPEYVLKSVRKNKTALKAPITTPVCTGFRSVNVALRKQLDLYACVRPTKTMPGIKTKFDNVDLVIFRENTEDLYSGIEAQVDENTAESTKRITRFASERIAKAAFEFAKKEGKTKVTAVTKANICKLSDGLFLKSVKDVAKKYPDIQFEELLIDNMCLQLVQYPELYQVLVLPNLYGDIVSDLAAGLTGGLGIAPGANLGDEIAIFEPVHGSSPSLKGLNKANPTALILSAVMMLRHIGEAKAAKVLYNSVVEVLKKGEFVTFDLGGHASTMEMAEAIAKEARNILAKK